MQKEKIQENAASTERTLILPKANEDLAAGQAANTDDACTFLGRHKNQ